MLRRLLHFSNASRNEVLIQFLFVQTEISNISSANCVEDTDNSIIVLLNSRSTRDIRVFSLTDDILRETQQQTLGILTTSLETTNFPLSTSDSYIVKRTEIIAVAVLFSDCIVFGTINRGSFGGTAVVKNELTCIFEKGSWTKQDSVENEFVFAAFRCDSTCLFYRVHVDDMQCIDELVLMRQMSLASPCTCFVNREGSSYMLKFSPDRAHQHSSHLIATVERLMTSGKRPPVVLKQTFIDHSSILILHIVLVRKEYNLLYLKCDGEVSLVASDIQEKKRVAFEENPYDVTSCLAFFHQDSIVCVLGFLNGVVKVFRGGRLDAVVRMTHCGPVDYIISLPKLYDSSEGSKFVSISSAMGTICFHEGEQAVVIGTVTSPSQPLTACFVDHRTEYLFAFSKASGNLWHLPTCRLERSFADASHFSTDGLVNLFCKQRVSAIWIDSISFLDGIKYFSVCFSLGAVAQTTEKSGVISDDYRTVLALLLSACGESLTENTLVNTSLLTALQHVQLNVASSASSYPEVAAVILLGVALRFTKSPSEAACAATLLPKLHASLFCRCEGSAEAAVSVLCSYYYSSFDTCRSNFVFVRHAFTELLQKFSDDLLCEVVGILQRPLKAQWLASLDVEDSENGTPDNRLMPVLMCVLMITRRRPSLAECEKSIKPWVPCFITRCVAVLKANPESLPDGFEVELLAFSEGYPLFKDVSGLRDVVDNLCNRLFERTGCMDDRQLLLEAVLRIAAHDIDHVLATFFVRYVSEQPSWSIDIVAFLCVLVNTFSCRAAEEVSAIFDFTMRIIEGKGRQEDHSSPQGAVTQLVHTATSVLPNVSFQRHLQQLAVGRPDGYIKVYCLKTGGVVSCFQAHDTPVLGVSYSSNMSTSEIASFSDCMDEVVVWRAPNVTAAFLSTFLTTSSKQFQREGATSIPSAATDIHDTLLHVRFCRVRWLSPQCVEFSSPWHGRIQMAL